MSVMISARLDKCERNTPRMADVTQMLPLAQSTVSQHIKVLLDAGLVERHAKGTRNCYKLRTDRLAAFGSACSGLFAGLTTEPAPIKELV